MKKVISYLITIMMVFTMMPYVAFADNVNNQTAAENETIALYVEQSNELYTEGDAEPEVEVIDVEPFSDIDEGIAPNGSGETQYAETVEEAAAGLRASMVERQANVVVNIKVDELTEETLTTKCAQIFEEALKHTGNPKEGDSLKWVWENWNCSITGTSDGTNCYAEITYNISYYTTAEQEATLTTEVEALKTELNLDGKTDYEKVKAIYDYITRNVSYDYNTLLDDSYKLKYTAYAALINKTAVCQGYAILFYRLSLEYGIDSRIVTGVSNNEAHGWNIVKLDEKYYYVDSTWDADNNNYNYFLKGTNDFTDHENDEYYDTEAFRAAYPIANIAYEVPEDILFTEGNYSYKVIAGKAYIEKYTGEESNVVVPSTLGGYSVIEVGSEAFLLNQNIRSIEFSEGIQKLGPRCMYFCDSLKTIKIPSTIKTLAYDYGNGNVEGVSGDLWVLHCSNIEEVIISPDNTNSTSIDGVVYSKDLKTLVYYPPGKKDLSYTIEDGATRIGDDAFAGNIYLKNVTMHDDLERIGYWAFNGCSNLTSVNISENCCFIGQYAFQHTNISSIHIPASVETIVWGAFCDTYNLGQVTVDKNNKFFSCIDGVLMRGTDIFLYPSKKKGATYEMPETVTGIFSCAFEGNQYLESITLNNNITVIPYRAFYECKELKKIIIPEGITEIGSIAFLGCDNLFKVEIPDTVVTIERNAFNSDSIIIYGVVGSAAEKYASENNIMFSSLGEDEIKGSCGGNVFWKLNDNTITIYGEGAMNDYNLMEMQPWYSARKTIEKIEIEEGVTYIGDYAFGGAINLKNVVISEGVISLGINSFAYAEQLSEITLPHSLERFPISAINNSGLNKITILNKNCMIEIDDMFGQSVTMRGYKNSTAESFAQREGLKFEVHECNNHRWGEEYIIDLEPTCCESGFKSIHCKYCDFTNNGSVIEIDALGHNMIHIDAISATCTNDGIIKHYKCSKCNNLYTDLEGKTEITEAETVEPATGHSYGEWNFDVNNHWKKCVCGDILEKGAHDFEWIIDGEATEEVEGFKHQECIICGTQGAIESIDKLEHQHKMAKTEAVAASCEENGNIEYYKCETCGNIYADETGQRQITSDETIVNAIGHSFSDWEVTTEPTCTEKGEETRTCACGEKETRPAEKIGHDYDVAITEPTCTEKGYTTYTCKNDAKHTHVADYVDAAGHKMTFHEAESATCEEAGNIAYYTCDVCGGYFLDEAGNEMTAADKVVVEAVKHDYESVVTVPTCEEYGYTTYTCSVCNDSYVEDGDDPLDHDYEAVETKPTCTEGGYITYTCKRDATHTYTTDLDPDGHEMKEHAAVEATCEEAGNIAYYTCNVCEGYFMDEKGEEATTADKVVVAATGHKYGAYKTTTKAKFGKAGKQTATCTACSDKVTKAIAAPKTIKLSYTSYTYNGKIKKPTVKAVYDSNGNKISSANYKVSYASGRKNVGKYKVTVTFNKNSANYTGSSYTTFKINPKGTSISSLAKVKKGFTVKWKKQTGKMATSRITGYQYRYSTSSKMTSATIKTVKGYGKTSAKKTGLKAKKTYYVQVRTYKTVSGVKYYSPWSKYKKVKTK